MWILTDGREKHGKPSPGPHEARRRGSSGAVQCRKEGGAGQQLAQGDGGAGRTSEEGVRGGARIGVEGGGRAVEQLHGVAVDEEHRAGQRLVQPCLRDGEGDGTCGSRGAEGGDHTVFTSVPDPDPRRCGQGGGPEAEAEGGGGVSHFSGFGGHF